MNKNCLTDRQTDRQTDKEYVGIKVANKFGYEYCEIGGVADFLYPTSNSRRGRVQGNGQISPTITAENTGVCRVEKIGNLFEKNGQAGNIYDGEGTAPCLPGFGGGGGGKELKYIEKEGIVYPNQNVTEGEEVDWNNTEYRIRKLTHKECFRLMGVTEEDAEKMMAVNSPTQCYKQAGNSIVVSVLMAVYSQLNIKGVTPWNDLTVDQRYELINKGCYQQKGTSND